MGFEPERGTLRAYLYGIGRKQAGEWWRRQKPSEGRNEDRAGRHMTTHRISNYAAECFFQ